MNTLILLLYYNRPELVRNALKSIQNQSCPKWHLAFLDDGSPIPGEPIVREMFTEEELQKVTFYNTNFSEELKAQVGGSHIGNFMNQAIKDSDCELAMMLCDDDALTPHYIWNIQKYFRLHMFEVYGYSYVTIYDPYNTSLDDLIPIKTECVLNNHQGKDIQPSCYVDASQVVWRTKCNTVDDIWFEYPLTEGLDAPFYLKLYEKYGPCKFMGCIGQYKGVHQQMLSKPINNL